MDAGRRKQTRVHGMNIHGGESRIGTEKLACSTCHMTSTQPNEPAPAPPRAGIDWQLAPVAFIWFGKSGAEICAQLKDPKRNGGRDAAGLVRTPAARCIVKRLHPSRVGTWSRPLDPSGDVRGSRQRHGPVGSSRATMSELTVCAKARAATRLMQAAKSARLEPGLYTKGRALWQSVRSFLSMGPLRMALAGRRLSLCS